MSTKQEIISGLFRQGILVTPTILQQIESGATLQQIITSRQGTTIMNTGDDATDPSRTNHQENITTGTKAQPATTKQAPPIHQNTKYALPLDQNGRAPLHITFTYNEDPRPHSVQDFVSLFNKRFDALAKIIKTHGEIESLTSIRRLKDLPKEQRKKVAIIGIIYNIRTSKNGHLIVEVEDKTGRINILINKDKPDIFSEGKQLVLDDTIGVVGAVDEEKAEIMFANTIVFPDVPHMEFKKAPFPVKAAFTSDLHYGAKMFMTEAFEDFIAWINSQPDIKYLFLVGDLVEGVGIYPGQEKDLAILDIEEQYKGLTNLLKKIRNDIHIIACGGNHDAMRIAEPQPVFYEKYSSSLYSLDNFTAVSSPSVVTIAKTEDFPGFDILLYHGYSFPYYFDGVEFLRQAGGINRIDLVMEFLLKRRHLAPTHTSTQYVPDGRDDFLVIKKVPDFFVSGHIHKVVNRNYKNVTMLNCSAWFGETDYMIKRGIIADPAKVLLANLQTREVTQMDFERKVS